MPRRSTRCCVNTCGATTRKCARPRFQALQEIARASLAIFESQTGEPFPQKPLDQLEAAIEAVFASWNSERAQEYRRLNAPRRCVRNGGHGATDGVRQRRRHVRLGRRFHRDPSTGEPSLYIDFLFNAQGEDVVSGRHQAEDAAALAALLPETADELARAAQLLEREFGDVQEFEFTMQDGRLYLLQTRQAKRTAWAALRTAVDLVSEGAIDPATALQRLDGVDLDRIAQVRVTASRPALARGVPASLGVATGEIAFDAATARRYKTAGRSVILVRDHPSTEDIAGIAAADGLLCASGGRTSHAAVVARQLDKVCVVGCEALVIDPMKRRCRLGETELAEGATVSLDGATGEVHAGTVDVQREVPHQWLRRVEQWRAAASAGR